MRPLLFILAIILGQSVFAQSSEYPLNFSELLKPGDYVGVNRDADTDISHITVYSEQVFKILRDAQKFDESELEEKYPELLALKAQYKKTNEASQAPRRDGMVAKYKSVSVYSYKRTIYSQVAFVGNDYFVVREPSVKERGSAISFRFVQSISWREDIPFVATFDYVTAE
jgi:hypothetical protein